MLFRPPLLLTLLHCSWHACSHAGTRLYTPSKDYITGGEISVLEKSEETLANYHRSDKVNIITPGEHRLDDPIPDDRLLPSTLEEEWASDNR